MIQNLTLSLNIKIFYWRSKYYYWKLIENSIESFIDYSIDNKFIKIQILQNKSFFSISVTDNGKSISDDILNKIFDYGFSTKGKNRGVGLYLVQEKLKLYNGNIRIERDESKKTFIIEVKNEECSNCWRWPNGSYD